MDLEFYKDLFAPFGDITIRKMFGGAGIYCDSVIFALIVDEEVRLKVDDETRAEFESAGMLPFTFEMKGKSATMSYYSVPDDIYDDEETLQHWTRLALGAAMRGHDKKRKTATRKKTTKRKATAKSRK